MIEVNATRLNSNKLDQLVVYLPYPRGMEGWDDYR